jgi:hypothetical protein
MDDDLPLTSSLGDTVDVVVLRQQGAQAVPIEGTMPLPLDEPTEPTGDLLEDLLDSTVRLSASEGLPKEVLTALLQTPVPTAFSESPWLRDSRAVVLIDGQAQVGCFSFRYALDTGLDVVDVRTDTPQTNLRYPTIVE